MPSATSTTETVRLEIEAQAGGNIQDILVKGNLAYVAQGARLIVLDVSNPGDPKPVGQTDLLPIPSLYVGLFFVRDDLIYWPCEKIQIIDVHDPTHPVLVGQVPWEPRLDEIVVKDRTAYFFETVWEEKKRTTRLYVLDLSDPFNPQEVAVVDMDGITNRATLFGEKIYSINSSVEEKGLLAVIDIADPEHPQVTMYPAPFRFLVPDFPYGFSQQSMYDLTDPASIQRLSDIPLMGGYGAVASEGFLYIADALSEDDNDGHSDLFVSNSHLAIIDYRDPKQPKMVVGANPAQWINFQSGFQTKISGSTLYVIDARGLSIIDVKDPAHPRLLKQIWSANNSAGSFEMVIHKGVIYYANRLRTDSLYVYDFRDPDNPDFAGLFPPSLYDGQMYLAGQDKLYISLYDDPRNYTQMRWRVVDIHQPDHPRLIKEIRDKDIPRCIHPFKNAEPGLSSVKVFYLGNLSGPGHTVFLDTSQPLNPCIIGALPYEGYIFYQRDVIWDGSHIYLLVDYKQIGVYDPLIKPGELIKVGSLDLPSDNAMWVEPQGDTIYLAMSKFSGSALSIYTLDRTDPASPRIAHAWDFPPDLIYAYLAGFSNQYAVVVDDGEINIFDLTLPDNPVIAGKLKLPSPFKVKIVDGRIYAVDTHSDFYLLRLTKIEGK